MHELEYRRRCYKRKQRCLSDDDASVIIPDWDNIRGYFNTTVLHSGNDAWKMGAVLRAIPLWYTRWQLTLVGTVGVSLVAVIPTVVVPVARPVLRDAAAAVAFKLDAGARMAAAGFIAVIATVVVCRTRAHVRLKSSF